MADAERQERIIELIRAVPEGFVTTYGDLCPEAPRLPGRVLAMTRGELPWHRIVRADGTYAQGERQRRLLRREGIPFTGKRVDMDAAHIPREALLANRLTRVRPPAEPMPGPERGPAGRSAVAVAEAPDNPQERLDDLRVELGAGAAPRARAPARPSRASRRGRGDRSSSRRRRRRRRRCGLRAGSPPPASPSG